uniref:LSDAT_euk domain-containing protein n=1 Tax=Heterorhabditis bacteriophora TaxID=37862 RepID=A0A1I7XNA3_HETBA
MASYDQKYYTDIIARSSVPVSVSFRLHVTEATPQNTENTEDHAISLKSTMRLSKDNQEKVRLLYVDDGVFSDSNKLPPDEEDFRPDLKKRRRHRRRRSGSLTGGGRPWKGRRTLMGYAIPPPNVHSTDWRDMLSIAESKDVLKNVEDNQPTPLFSQMRFADSDLSLNRVHWITETFTRRECARFVPTNKDPEKCGCGRLRTAHIDIPTLTSTFLNHRGRDYVDKKRITDDDNNSDGLKMVQTTRRTNRSVCERWSLKKHTICLPTNAFGQIEFQGGPHPYKAQYVRLNFDTDPAHIMSMFEEVWMIAPPKLIITVHGGTNNFDIQTKLARVFRKGLLKAAMTTGAWIITSGIDAGVVRHVAAAFEGNSELDVCVPYYPFSSKSRFTVLNNRHSYFLLVDNGTVGRLFLEYLWLYAMVADELLIYWLLPTKQFLRTVCSNTRSYRCRFQNVLLILFTGKLIACTIFSAITIIQ